VLSHVPSFVVHPCAIVYLREMVFVCFFAPQDEVAASCCLVRFTILGGIFRSRLSSVLVVVVVGFVSFFIVVVVVVVGYGAAAAAAADDAVTAVTLVVDELGSPAAHRPVHFHCVRHSDPPHC
jgi:hypothetical protein